MEFIVVAVAMKAKNYVIQRLSGNHGFFAEYFWQANGYDPYYQVK